jgi:hypothetical protein
VSEHNPAQKRAIVPTLVSQAKAICDPGSSAGEMDCLKKTVQNNGYSPLEIKCGFKTIHHPVKKNNLLRLVKESLECDVLGIYSILSLCVCVCIRKTGHNSQVQRM